MLEAENARGAWKRRGPEGEEASVRDLSPSRQKVQDLAEALVRGTVTPVGLRDVVDDWLLE